MSRLVMATRHRVAHTVISLGGPGAWGAPLSAAGIPVLCIGMQRIGVNPLDWYRVIRALRGARADVVQTWMYHSDLVGGVAGRIAGSRAIAWGVRNLELPSRSSRLSTRMVRRICAWLSNSLPDVIICSSRAAAAHHRDAGYAADKLVVIHNGVDTAVYRPDEKARARLRDAWAVPASVPVVGMVARWDPLKDHTTLLGALGRLVREFPEVRCVLAGAGIDTSNADLARLLRDSGIAGRVMLLGCRDDVADIMNAIDLHVLSSCSESFPNVVAEAMACGTPCVSTNVGDAALITGEFGAIVPPRDPERLAHAMSRCLSDSASASSRAQRRQWIEREFAIEAMAGRFMETWLRIGGTA